jgi:CO/xanthine dehydrogenase Mo-binding subunit
MTPMNHVVTARAGPLRRAPERPPHPPLAEWEALFVGDPVALVLAESRYLAEDGADLVKVNSDQH